MNDDIAGPAGAPEPSKPRRLPHYLALVTIVVVVVVVLLTVR